MAQVDSSNNPNDPENPNSPANPQNQQQDADPDQPSTTGGGGAVTSTGAGNVTGQVAGTANPSQPFQNIASYLSANQPQSKQLADQVAGTVSAPINDASQGITSAADSFTKSVNAGFTPENKDLITAVSSNPAYVVGQNAENTPNFLAQLNNKYTGPTDFTQGPGYSDLQAKIAKAQGQAANTQTPEGVQTLLKSVEGPTTAGINKFDSILLNQNPENLKTIQNAGTGAANLLPTLNQTTTAQNALASEGSKTAAQTAADALAALNTARGSVSKNLGDEQKTIEGVVNQYNQSVGVINPVVADISSAISNFLANNPNIKFGGGEDPLSALKNLANIVMPELATYASPEDYAQIAALTQLGDTNVGNLPIGSSTADQAQSFKVPTQLMDAIGKAPGVQSALQNELGGFGDQINAAIKPYQDTSMAAYNYTKFGKPAEYEAQKLEKQIGPLKQQLDAITSGNTYGGNFTNEVKAIQAQIAPLQEKLDAAKATMAQYPQASWDAVGPIAQGLQWVNGTAGSYQELIDAINGDLGKLGSIGAPTLQYGPNAMAAPKTGDPIGKVQKDTANAAGVGVGAGIPAATAAGLLSAGIPTTATALAQAAPGTVAGQVPAAGLSGIQTLGPAAIAAYGTSNIVQNSMKNPIESGIMSLANTGLSLATLSLPPQIFQSIGKEINNVIHSIGDFFGGLF